MFPAMYCMQWREILDAENVVIAECPKLNHQRMTRLAILLMLVFYTSCKGQNKAELPKDNVKPETKEVIISTAPSSIVRNIEQDRKGNIWMASWQGVYRYDGKAFFNITSGVSSARFFSVLED